MFRQVNGRAPLSSRTPTTPRPNPIGAPGYLAYFLLALALASGLYIHASGAALPGPRTVEVAIRDGLTRALAGRGTNGAVALVDIDEDSLRSVGPWPWPRTRLADLAEQLLAKHRVELVVLDLVLPEPAAGHDAVGDARLAALGQAGLLVPAQAFDYVRRPRPIMTGTTGGGLTAHRAANQPVATGYVANFPSLARARCVGNIGFVPDFDGQVRRLPPLTQWRGALFPTLALAAVHCTHGDAKMQELLAHIRVDDSGYWELPWKTQHFLTVPAHAVLGDATLPSLAEHVVFVGSSALGLSDRVATPVSASTAGVTVHATAFSGMLEILTGKVPPTPPKHLLGIWLVSSTVALWWGIVHGTRVRTIAVTLVLMILAWLVLASWAVYSRQVQPVTSTLWSYACLLGTCLPVEWSRAQARLRARTRLLSRYLAKPVLEELLANEENDPLTPRLAEISVLIADLQDHTHITAHSTLEEAASLTRQILDCLTRPVLLRRGTLDNYTGDGLIAFWGAPMATDDHANRALLAAIDIQQELNRLNQRRCEQGRFPLRVRIGIATGSALVGDLGTPFRSTYTAVGAVVNLAARLQQAARDMPFDILVSSETAAAVRGHPLRPIGTISLHGLPTVDVFTPQITSPGPHSQRLTTRVVIPPMPPT